MEHTFRKSRLRFLALLPASALLLAGCAATDGSDGSSNKLTVWHYFSEDTQVGVMTSYEELFEASHPEVDVENVYVPYDQFSSKLIAGAGSSTGPDVVVFNGGEASTLALAGTLAPMDEYWDDFADAAQFPEGVVHQVDGSVYMAQGYVNLLGLWYNQDILDEIGVKPPTTIDELNSAMAAAKAAGYEGITLSGMPQGQGEWQAYPWLSAGGFDWDNLDTAALTEGYELVKSWVDNGYLSAESATWDQTVPFQRFAAGGVAFEFPVHPIQETGKRPTAALDRNLAYLSLVESLYGYFFDGVVLTALRETETSLDTYAHDLQRQAALKAARDQAVLAEDQARRLYQAGRSPYLAGLDAQRTLAGAEAALAASDSQVAVDQVNLFLALGGGWE